MATGSPGWARTDGTAAFYRTETAWVVGHLLILVGLVGLVRSDPFVAMFPVLAVTGERPDALLSCWGPLMLAVGLAMLRSNAAPALLTGSMTERGQEGGELVDRVAPVPKRCQGVVPTDVGSS